MGLADRYQELEVRFSEKASEWKRTYLPYRTPTKPVDYILVCMEPSSHGVSSDASAAAIRSGFRNFSLSREDFILHHCVRVYLCQGGETYFLTDVDKGMMKVEEACPQRARRYETWRDLLVEEINLVARPDGETAVVAIGVDPAEQIEQIHEHLRARYVGRTLHYSRTGMAHRQNAKYQDPGGYDSFRSGLDGHAYLTKTTTDTLSELGINGQSATDRLSLVSARQLSECERMLMFTYFRDFATIRSGGSLRR